MIELRNIAFHYPGSDFRLDISSLQVEKGGGLAITGPSGFGKTTLLNLLAGILLPDAGEVEVGGLVVNRLNDKERRDFRIRNIGHIFQDFRLIPYLHVLDNILLPYRISNAMDLNAARVASATALAERLGLGGKLRKHPSRLSHGERQRVAICRALLTRPALILADEPTGNLDPLNKERIMEILFECVADAGATLVHVTHDMSTLRGFDQVFDFSDHQATGP